MTAAPARPSSPAGAFRAARAGLCATLLAACGAPGDVPYRPAEGLVGAPLERVAVPELLAIRRLEERRDDAADELADFLEHPDARVRARAALALGRLVHPLGGAAVTQALCRALADPDAEVRATVAFALGIRADPAAAGCLLNHWNDPDPLVRAALARAATHVDRPELRLAVIRALRDPSLAVRIEAACATAQWDPEATDARSVDTALLGTLVQRPAPGAEPSRTELVWRTLYALGRRRAEKGRAVYLPFADSPEPQVRLFATRALARIAPAVDVQLALESALADPDWRVACEAAAGLGHHVGDPEAATALLGSVEHPSHHVRRTAIAALGRVGVDTREVRARLWRGARDLSAAVRAEALDALALLLPDGGALSVVEEHRGDSDPWVRRGAARAAARLQSERAVPLLIQMARDEDRRVAAAALEGLGRHPTEASRSLLLQTLGHPDNGSVLAALLALRESARASDVPALRDALGRVRGDIAAEIALNAVLALGEIGGPEARGVVEGVLDHPDRYVRRIARRTLEESFRVAPPAGVPRTGAESAEDPADGGRELPTWTADPLVVVETTRGALVFELFPADAPLHVHNFLELAERGHYDGLVFHRVVPGFVVQGGDYRGDGNGGRSWDGAPLRNEFGPRKFVRGSLGMPRYADPDSGGSQFFVTHRPTPHLDGRYTLFGELRRGGEVLDALEVGDRILSVQRVAQPRQRR